MVKIWINTEILDKTTHQHSTLFKWWEGIWHSHQHPQRLKQQRIASSHLCAQIQNDNLFRAICFKDDHLDTVIVMKQLSWGERSQELVTAMLALFATLAVRVFHIYNTSVWLVVLNNQHLFEFVNALPIQLQRDVENVMCNQNHGFAKCWEQTLKFEHRHHQSLLFIVIEPHNTNWDEQHLVMLFSHLVNMTFATAINFHQLPCSFAIFFFTSPSNLIPFFAPISFEQGRFKPLGMLAR